MEKYSYKTIELEHLVLDENNPRFAELYNGSEKENEIIEYLLYTEAADEIAKAISTAKEFYQDRPLWVYKQNGKYLVKDGNRRCAAVKALQHPQKYGLNIQKIEFEELPVLVYDNLADLDVRIRLEHNSNAFRKWGRIAKALEIYRLFSSGNSIDSLTDIDSKPKDFIKLASFYREVVKIEGEKFKRLVREGRGRSGGKTIIFERLFRERTQCGYFFKRDSGEIVIKDQELFKAYIHAIVNYLTDHADMTSRMVDEIGTDAFLKKLKSYNFPPENTEEIKDFSSEETPEKESQSSAKSFTVPSPATPVKEKQDLPKKRKRHSIKTKPILERKQIPRNLKRLIDECYNLDENNFANAKICLTRVVFECVLKYVVENTKDPNGKDLKDSNHFARAFKGKNGEPLLYTNFTTLKSKFIELIKNTGIRKAFENFDLEYSHQIIHNYRVGTEAHMAKTICGNLIDLLEFMLQEEADIIDGLDVSKL